MARAALINALARCLVAGDGDPERTFLSTGEMLGKPWPWLWTLALRYADAFRGRARPTESRVVEFLRRDTRFQRVRAKHWSSLVVTRWTSEPPRMVPVDAAREWELPPLETPGALADWLQLSLDELAWFADLKGILSSRCDTPLVHYHYRLLTKSSGGFRLLEAPKPRLKQLQRQVLSGILERVPAHPAVHGFRKGRSIKTFAAPHAGCRVVLKMDLSDFFPTFPAARVAALFRSCGYPETVAALLTGLCTNQAPRSLWRGGGQAMREARDLYCRPHLPQGAPTSPAIANACAYRMDLRLSGLARSAGAAYTRYADDLAFSGDGNFERGVDRFAAHVAALAHEEGFTVHHRKTRVMRQGVRQHLAGLVTNEGVNIIRADFDRLKAILHNCVRHGPASQNRDNHPHYRQHLEGRVAFVEMLNPAKAARLRDLLARISW